MKAKLATLAFLILLTGKAFSQQHNLVVVVKNVKESTGKISVALFDNANDFIKKGVQEKKTFAVKGEVQITFENVNPGDYAISVIHDANQNDELDSNAFGIPKEGFGFSNDAMGMFGPPSFEKAKFKFSEDDKITLTLKYM